MAKIDEYAEIVKQMVDDDKTRDALYQDIDNAIACRFEPSSEVTDLPWIQNRHYGLTNIADARNAGARTFSTLLPDIEISPLRDDDKEYQRAEMAEQIWQWEFARMNRVQTNRGFHDKIVSNAITYHAVALQTEYLPFKFKGIKNANTKAVLAKKKFNWSIHHPGTVHSQTNDYDQLQRVAKVVCMTAQELIDNFGENKGVAKLKEKHAGAKKDELMRLKYTLVDYTDWDKRVKWAFPDESAGGRIAASDVVFMNEEHKLPFIPWVIINYGDPLWQSVIQSGLWENLQYVNMLVFAKALEQSTRSTFAIRTLDGTLQNVHIDFTNPSNPIVADKTTDFDNLQAPQIDPQMTIVLQQMEAQLAASTVSQVLTNVGQYSDAPFSTVERIVQLALGQLSPAKKTAEAAEEEGIYQGFQWIEHSKIPLVGYRSNTSDAKMGDKPKQRGEQIAIWPGPEPEEEEIMGMSAEEMSLYGRQVYFDLEQLYPKVTLQANNVADEQTRLNLYINAVDRMGMSKKDAWDKLGWKNYKLSEQHRIEEVMLDQAIQLDFERERAKIQIEAQQAAQQIQMQAQQAAQEQNLENQQAQMNAGSQFESIQGQDFRNGGAATAQAAPFETRERVRGKTLSGIQTV